MVKAHFWPEIYTENEGRCGLTNLFMLTRRHGFGQQKSSDDFCSIAKSPCARFAGPVLKPRAWEMPNGKKSTPPSLRLTQRGKISSHEDAE